MTSGMSCSIMRIVAPVVSLILRNSGPSASVSFWLIPDAGSSSSNMVGFSASMQPISRSRSVP